MNDLVGTKNTFAGSGPTRQNNESVLILIERNVTVIRLYFEFRVLRWLVQFCKI